MITGSVEGMWTVWFRGVVGEGCGVLVLETERVFGGDSGWYYLGSYSIRDNQFKARVRVTHYGAWIDAVSGHGPADSPFDLTISGDRIDSRTIAAQGTTEDGSAVLDFQLRKIAELP